MKNNPFLIYLFLFYKDFIKKKWAKIKEKNTVFTEFCTKTIVKNEKNVNSTTNEQIKTVYSNWKMPQSGVGSMRGSKERTHTRGGRTHNVTQRTDTHISKGGGRTHNVTQRTDTQISFYTRN